MRDSPFLANHAIAYIKKIHILNEITSTVTDNTTLNFFYSVVIIVPFCSVFNKDF